MGPETLGKAEGGRGRPEAFAFCCCPRACLNFPNKEIYAFLSCSHVSGIPHTRLSVTCEHRVLCPARAPSDRPAWAQVSPMVIVSDDQHTHRGATCPHGVWGLAPHRWSALCQPLADARSTDTVSLTSLRKRVLPPHPPAPAGARLSPEASSAGGWWAHPAFRLLHDSGPLRSGPATPGLLNLTVPTSGAGWPSARLTLWTPHPRRPGAPRLQP